MRSVGGAAVRGGGSTPSSSQYMDYTPDSTGDVYRSSNISGLGGTPRFAAETEGKAPPILCLDMDETLGSFGPFCIGVKIWKHFDNNNNPPPAVSIQHHLHKQGPGERSAFRPGVRELIQKAKQMLDTGRLKEIIIFTSASNAGGYIDYVKECICHHAEVPLNTI